MPYVVSPTLIFLCFSLHLPTCTVFCWIGHTMFFSTYLIHLSWSASGLKLSAICKMLFGLGHCLPSYRDCKLSRLTTTVSVIEITFQCLIVKAEQSKIHFAPVKKKINHGSRIYCEMCYGLGIQQVGMVQPLSYEPLHVCKLITAEYSLQES